MPISPTGNRKIKQAGFTLVEVLAVLLIFGLMAGAVIINMPARPNPLYKQGELLATHIELTAQTGIIRQQVVGIRFTDDSYEIVSYLDGEWKVEKEINYDPNLKPHIELVENSAKIDLELAEKSGIPSIRYDTTGLGTPFELKLENGASQILLIGTIDGHVTIEIKP